MTGVLSIGVYPVDDSLALLARTGITGGLGLFALYAGATLDLAFGAATLLMRRRRRLYQAQLLVILAYTAIITWHLPGFWLHPYGPILKNLPILAAIWLLHETEERA
ncbi:DoxX-like family protein [Lysobacter sp. D1-1-M9]|uniref:DoxX-like family protein n=1 Tax=Novilysobacter longmucuonensis TaxID=3098603 RepID=UPI002FC8718F